MKALSLWQPWASLVAVGAKRIETRHWPTTYRGPLAIHATKRRPSNGPYIAGDPIHTLAEWARASCDGDYIDWSELPFGAIVATCELVDVVRILATGDDIGSRVRYVAPDDHGVLRVWMRSTLSAFPVVDAFAPAVLEREFGDYRSGRYAWLLDNVQALDAPVPTRGAQGLWEWTP